MVGAVWDLTIFAVAKRVPVATFFARLERYQTRGRRVTRRRLTGTIVRIVSSKSSVKSNPPRHWPACGPNESSRREHEMCADWAMIAKVGHQELAGYNMNSTAERDRKLGTEILDRRECPKGRRTRSWVAGLHIEIRPKNFSRVVPFPVLPGLGPTIRGSKAGTLICFSLMINPITLDARGREVTTHKHRAGLRWDLPWL